MTSVFHVCKFSIGINIARLRALRIFSITETVLVSHNSFYLQSMEKRNKRIAIKKYGWAPRKTLVLVDFISYDPQIFYFL